MTRVFVDAMTLAALGHVGELELLGAFDGTIFVPDAVREQITTEPPATNLDRFCQEEGVVAGPVDTEYADEAMQVLGEDAPNGDTRLVEGVLAAVDAAEVESVFDDPDEQAVGLITDDRRLRTVGQALGATVTGTFGVVVRAAAADRYFSADQAKRVVRRIDSHGMHLTGELREQAVGEAES
jgi:predicted nucleic acid-binding protein